MGRLRTLRRQWWVTLVGAAAAIVVLFSVAGWSWTSLVVAVLILFFAGVGLLVLTQVLDAMGGAAKAQQVEPRGRTVLGDRRPILLANARSSIRRAIRWTFLGDLLIADGDVRDAKSGIGAAGVPEGTEIVECDGCVPLWCLG